jgi:hypothetical protein
LERECACPTAHKLKASGLPEMPGATNPQAKRLEDLPKMLGRAEAAMNFDPLNSRWHESVERDDPAPSYINIELSSGLVLKICQEDLINQIELGTIEVTSVTPEGSLIEKYPVDLSRVLSASDRRFLHAVGIRAEKDKA